MNAARSRHWRVEHESRSARGAQYAAQVRSCYKATALSTLIPAVGLFRVHRGIAAVIVTAFLMPLGYLGYLVLRDGAISSVLRIGVDQDKLLVLLALVVALAAVWIFGIIATSQGTRPARMRRVDRVTLTLFTAAMCAVIAAPTVLAVQGLAIQRDTIEEVVTSTTRPGVTEVEGRDPWAGQPRVNLLLLGSDSGPNREGTRPDSIMVASIDTASGDTVFIGLPRNLERVPFPPENPFHEIFPEGYNCGGECLLNGVWTLAEDRPDLFPADPSPGLTTMRDVAAEITGLQIDDSVTIDMSGFEQLVDAMGGVTINALERVPIGGKVVGGQVVDINGWIEPGVQHMDGYHALWYSRSRATTDDFSRMRRQRCVVGAIVDQVDPLRMLARYPQLAAAISDNVRVDIPADDLGAWAELVLRMKDGRLLSAPITNEVVNVGNPDFELIRTIVQDAITAPPPLPPPTATTTPPDSLPVPGQSPAPEPSEEPTDEVADLAATC